MCIQSQNYFDVLFTNINKIHKMYLYFLGKMPLEFNV